MARFRHPLGQAVSGLTFFVGAIVGYAPSNAASLALSPIRLSLTAKQPISALTVRNDGDEPTVVQLELAKWSQNGGKDVYTATTEILATPPIFTVPAHGSQLLRVGLRRTADAANELSYRVFLQEVSPPPTPDFKGLRVALRFGVPVFVAPLAASDKKSLRALPSLQWHARAVPGGLALNALNSGDTHVQVTDFTLTSSGAATPLASYKAPQYVLPGQNRDWVIKLDVAPTIGTPLHIVATTGVGAIQADAILESP